MATVDFDDQWTYEPKNTATAEMTARDIRTSSETVFHCHIALIREEDGSFSAIVLNLPGVGSCGGSEEEAIENVKEAICGMVESYTASGTPIPWQDPLSEDTPEDAKVKWILVNG